MPKMPFGPFAGIELDEVPAHYLLDLSDNDDPRLKQHQEVKNYIEINHTALVALSLDEEQEGDA